MWCNVSASVKKQEMTSELHFNKTDKTVSLQLQKVDKYKEIKQNEKQSIKKSTQKHCRKNLIPS